MRTLQTSINISLIASAADRKVSPTQGLAIMVRQHLDHALSFTADGAPIRDLSYPYACWHRTLRSLDIRYRKPYAARHSSVSWDLMIGRDPGRDECGGHGPFTSHGRRPGRAGIRIRSPLRVLAGRRAGDLSAVESREARDPRTRCTYPARVLSRNCGPARAAMLNAGKQAGAAGLRKRIWQ
jgi:hypothetical protein